MPLKIGFYVCHCGINIAGKVRVSDVADFARRIDHVVVSRDYKFMCSDPGQEMVIRDIEQFGLNRVVVASCSPRLHAKTFMSACARGGLNPYFFHMASVREQVSWVTADEDEATDKAKSLVAAAINRVCFHERLEAREAKVHPDVLVVGGGIAGIQAALDIGSSGHHVYLVERQPTIGGHMLQFDKTFPTLDCAACIGTPKMVEAAQDPNIELLSYSEVTEVSGFIGNYTVKIFKKPRYVKESICTGCGECAQICPVSLPSEWDEGLSSRKAVYRSFPQAVPITFCIDKRDRAPCVTACPAGINVQGYVQLIGQGKYREALELIMEKLPLPGVLGRVCPHPCESRCRRAEIEEAVAIKDLKRFVADSVDPARITPPTIRDNAQSVAVIGSGPAGLTAAWFLTLAGCRVTIFEALDKPGGMLRVGIPDYRLPAEVLDREIGNILKLGIHVETGAILGKNVHLNDLAARGFEAVILCIGAHASIPLRVPGEDADGVLDAVTFLREMNLGHDVSVGRKVVVVGGGNVAVDAARVALRRGADVTVVYRRSARDMPAYREEITEAVDEGVRMVYLTAPVRVMTKQGRVSGLECIRTELGPADRTGRGRPVPVMGSEFVLPADTIIPAIGQRVDTSWSRDLAELVWTPRELTAVKAESMQTSIPHVFAAGDMVTGPATVIEAVASGRKAADAVIRFLQGESPAQDNRASPESGESTKDWAPLPRHPTPHGRPMARHLDVSRRVTSFEEVTAVMTPEEALAEALRCLNCGVCCECMECVKVCEAKALDHQMKGEEMEIRVGSIILATGYDLLDPTPMKQFGYGVFPNVLTGLEFERLNNATGPTGGEIRLRDKDGRFTDRPESVAILHCIGSRDVNYHEYCSRVCCMYALKYGHLIHDKVGAHADIYDFYIDMRCFGKGYEEFFRRCQEEGVHFIRGKPAEITDRAECPEEEGKLIVIGEDTLLGQSIRVPVDMAILCTAMEARTDAPQVGRIFGVSQSRDGFFLEEHPKLAPLSTASDGVFLAGTCQAPRDVPDTVAQASGAAAKVLALVTRGKVQIEPTIAWINPDICAGCRICVGLCAYSAIEFDLRRRVSVVNEALCKGCGTCSGFCPSGAAQSKHFNSREIFAEIDGILDAVHRVGR
jgi:heterodisulfide reductase subunit A2